MKQHLGRTSLGIIHFVALAGMVPTLSAHSCAWPVWQGKADSHHAGRSSHRRFGRSRRWGTFSESGMFSGAQTTSIAGNFFDETFSGTRNLNPDCTGTATVNVCHRTTLARTTNLNLVWDVNGKKARAIFLTAGTAITIEKRNTKEMDAISH